MREIFRNDENKFKWNSFFNEEYSITDIIIIKYISKEAIQEQKYVLLLRPKMTKNSYKTKSFSVFSEEYFYDERPKIGNIGKTV